MLLECVFRPIEYQNGITPLLRNWKTLEEILGNKLKVNPS